MPLSSLTVAAALAAFAAVLGLIVLSGRLLRGAGVTGFRANQRLAIKESLALDRARSLRVVSCDGRDLLILVGGGSDVVIGWLPSAEVSP